MARSSNTNSPNTTSLLQLTEKLAGEVNLSPLKAVLF